MSTTESREAAKWARACLKNAAQHLSEHTEFPLPRSDVHMTCAALFLMEAMRAIRPHVFLESLETEE